MVLEIAVDQEIVLSADEILSFASVHGDFICVSDRISHRFEVTLSPESRLEVLKDALLQVVHLERDSCGNGGLNPYEVEDLIDALEKARQTVLDGDDTS
ncbi:MULTISPECIES: hypothetical protein [unclassified Methanoculleus]|uniref:hypothetical protein n=1 Tax=unclassified Methanoculleus TaxID=2619537 RepID=UPI0025E771C0|nr:hypothetical protein [Methanoculleus sp. UBA377]